ncbi:MAG: RidA family protein [Pseudohongiellaceae bacterium]
MRDPLRLLLGLLLVSPGIFVHADVTRHPLPGGSTFPISQAVEISSGSLVYFSGTTPAPVDATATRGTPAYYGDTETQTVSVFNRIQTNLENLGLGLGDVVKMTVFLVGDPALDNRMDFDGFMAGYTRFFGTEEQPALPSRSAVQVAGLVSPLMFVEVEVVAVRDTAAPGARTPGDGSRLRDSDNLLDFLGF